LSYVGELEQHPTLKGESDYTRGHYKRQGLLPIQLHNF